MKNILNASWRRSEKKKKIFQSIDRFIENRKIFRKRVYCFRLSRKLKIRILLEPSSAPITWLKVTRMRP